MNRTEQWLADHMAKFRRDVEDPHAPDKGRENKLSRKIRSYCKEHGYVSFVVPENPDIRKILPPGWPDVVIFLPKGRKVVIELKAAKGRLRKAQIQVRNMLVLCGHEYHVCKSWRRFMEIISE